MEICRFRTKDTLVQLLRLIIAGSCRTRINPEMLLALGQKRNGLLTGLKAETVNLKLCYYTNMSEYCGFWLSNSAGLVAVLHSLDHSLLRSNPC